jgi:CRISPR-associated endonuclease/helicase Cas3
MTRLGKRPRQETAPALPWSECIAKTTVDGDPGITVYEHCRTVGEVAGALLQRLAPAVLSLLGKNPVTVAALHDVGKVSPGYMLKHFRGYLEQRMPGLAAHAQSNYCTKHAAVGEAALNAYLKAGHRGSKFAAAVGAHHGIRDGGSLWDHYGELGGPAWAAERRELIEHLIQELGPLSEEQGIHGDLLAGLVCVADWIGSDEDSFPPSGLPEGTDLRSRADRAVAECGWELPEVRKGLSFQRLFGFQPYQMQKDFIASVDGRGVYVLEAPMGSGKTEAALYAAYKLMEAGHNSGLYFGLPTRLTSDKIHERVRPFVEQIAGEDAGTRLAHGQAWLRAFEHGGEGLGPGKDWFRPSKRALLVPFAVGTIDQALLAVLKVKHYFVRTFGLAGKVVILDEVHSYDMYTGTLLDVLVQRLLEIGCSVIVLSATLTRNRREALLDSVATTGPEEPYPLITAKTAQGISTSSAEGPEPKRVGVSLRSLSDQEVAEEAVLRASKGQCVVCIANTVAQAQRWYNEVKAAMPQGAFEVGLLHSKFPAWRRDAIEGKWTQALGKGDHGRPQGCVLVATQVLEQSVDIDADFLLTELAPTDMLLQRIGRLWRHPRPGRPCGGPEVFVITGPVEAAGSFDELVEALGRSNSYVYAPYMLWRSHRIWSRIDSLELPGDIRGLLEETYRDDEEKLPDFIAEARAQMERRKQKLHGMANAARADMLGFCTMEDDERAVTRYSDHPTTDALLVRSEDSLGKRATLLLSSGKVVRVDAFRKDFRATAELHKNLVAIPAYALPSAQTPDFLSKHFHGKVVLLVIGDGGELLLEGRPLGLRYDDERGVQREGNGSSFAPRRTPKLGGPYDPEEDFDEFDW